MIDNRLKTVFSFIPNCESFIDIGCDHGKLCQQVLSFGRAKHVTACDISAPSLNKAKQLLGDKAEYLLLDGATALKLKTYSCVAICGMGGMEIIRIIKDSKNPVLVLQPQTDVLSLRRYLINNGYKIVEDEVTFVANKPYDVIKAELGKMSLTDAELYFGAFALTKKSDLLIKKLVSLKDKILTYKQTQINKTKLKIIEEILSWQTSR